MSHQRRRRLLRIAPQHHPLLIAPQHHPLWIVPLHRPLWIAPPHSPLRIAPQHHPLWIAPQHHAPYVAPMLLPLDAALEALKALVPPATPALLPPFAAIGLVAAADVVAPRALPATAVALRPGHAVASQELVGASPQAPVLLMQTPPAVAIDAPLPPGTDAIISPDAIIESGGLVEITETPAPGEGVRLAGHDAAQGSPLVARGHIITPEVALAATLAGLEALPVITPRFRLAGEGPAVAWLAARLEADGVMEAAPGDHADLTLSFEASTIPVVAINPSACSLPTEASVSHAMLTLAPRFDGVVAVYAALLLPLIAARTGRLLRRETRPLAAKIASTVGFSDLILLKSEGDTWQPLATGFVTLETLLQADAFTLWPARSEGAAAGTPVAATPLAAPLAPDPAP